MAEVGNVGNAGNAGNVGVEKRWTWCVSKETLYPLFSRGETTASQIVNSWRNSRLYCLVFTASDTRPEEMHA